MGVDRSTVWRWRTGDAVFIAELNSRRQELWSAYADRLRGLAPKALQVLENTLECEPDSWRVALAVVKAAGLVDLGAYDHLWRIGVCIVSSVVVRDFRMG